MNDVMMGSLFAYKVMLTTLVAYAKREDPKFASFAQAQFDDFLGSMSVQGKDEIKEVLVHAREEYASLLESGILMQRLAAHSTKPLTRRRRFLNWLNAG